jgi:hypothetical protein
MPLRHVALFRFAETTTEAQIAELTAGLDKLPDAIPEIDAYQHGRDAGLNDTSWDYAVIGEFATPQDYLVYRDHPVHQHLIRTLVLPIVTDRASVQLTTG